MYCCNDEDMDELVAKEFQERTGIIVDIVRGGGGEILQRIKAEAINPQADVVNGPGSDSYGPYKEYLQPYVPKDKDFIVGGDPEGYWYGGEANPIMFIFNTNLLNEKDYPVAWRDLLDPKYKGRIAFADPEKASSGYAQLCTMVQIFGKENGKGWDYAREFLNNLDVKILSSSSEVPKRVANGEFAVGVTIESFAFEYLNSGAPIQVSYPSDGTYLITGGPAIVKGCKNPENAEAFVNFILSKEWQTVKVNKWARRSSRIDVQAPKGLPEISELVAIDYDSDWASNNREEILFKWKEMFLSND
ncbi:MAG TPA: extracellular solute-binding protein [Clostridiaceae bacterium]|nr:extracellular solute-binding protein [Clostridiaceae bacterium]